MQKTKEKEVAKLQKELDEFEDQCKTLTQDRMNQAPILEQEPQTKLSQKQIEKTKEIYLKPARSISVPEKFNETYREEWNFAKEYVKFIAEHKEIIGETIELWTKPFAGIPAEYWQIPVNTPVCGPRYLAERIRACKYHRLSMEERYTADNIAGTTGMGTIYGKIVVDNTVQRLSAEPLTDKKSIFMGIAA